MAHSPDVEHVRPSWLNAEQIVPNQASFVVPELRRRRLELGVARDDGFPGYVNDEKGLYGKEFFLQHEETRAFLEADPNYQFASLVAGFTDAPVTEYYNESSVAEEVRDRVLRAQNEAARARSSVQYIETLRKRVADLSVREKEALKRKQEADATQKRLVTTRKAASQALGRVGQELKTAKDSKAEFGNRTMFDYLTRGASALHGNEGFRDEAFYIEMLSINDAVCQQHAQSVQEQEKRTGNVAEEIPATSRLAFYLAFLVAYADSASLQTLVGSRVLWEHDSVYGKDPRQYSNDLLRLKRFLFDTNNPNYLYYKFITVGSYALIRLMQTRANSVLDLVQRVVVQRTDANEDEATTIQLFENVTYTLLLLPEEGGDEDDFGAAADIAFTEDQRAQFRDHVAMTRDAPIHYVNVLLSLMQPAIRLCFSSIAYDGNTTLPLQQLGGRPGGTVPRRLYSRYLGDDMVHRAYTAKNTTEREEALKIESRTRRSTRRNKARFAGIGAPQKHDQDANIDAIKNDLELLPGLLALSAGIFVHSLAKDPGSTAVYSGTDQTIAHLMMDAKASNAIGEIQTLSANKYGSYDEKTPYFDDLRRRALLLYAVDPVSQLLVVARSLPGLPARATAADYTTLMNGSDDEKLAVLDERLLEADPDKQVAVLPLALQLKTKTLKTAYWIATEDNPVSLADLANKEAQEAHKTLRDLLDRAENELNERVLESDRNAIQRAGNNADSGRDLIIDPRAALNELNTGTVRLTPLFRSALSKAERLVYQFAPCLRSWSRHRLQHDLTGGSVFAELVANQIYKVRIRFPDEYRSNKAVALQMRDEQSLITELKYLAGGFRRQCINSLPTYRSRPYGFAYDGSLSTYFH